MKRRGKQVGALLALVVVVAVVAVVLVIVLANNSSGNGGSGQTPSYTGTATVQRRNLVATDTESGTLSYANPQTVYDGLSGTITWLPGAGRVIKPGRALFDVDNKHVLLMNGTTPAFRNLTFTDTAGPDILELNRNLVALGYEPYTIDIDDEWQAATTDGVEALQKAQGWYESGALTLGQVDFLPGTQLVATTVGTLGSTVAGGTSATAATTAPASTRGRGSAAAGTGAGSGGGGTSTQMLTTNSTQLVVTVDLDASLQSEATLGERVTVEMPDGSNVGGKVTAVSAVAQSSGSSDDSGSGGGGDSGGSGSGSATVPITITLDKRAKGAGLDQASVSVSFTQAKAKHVLSVPVTALIATSGEKFAVQEAQAPYKLIHVTAGLFAAGDVQISGSGIHPGLKVTDSQG